MKKAMIIVEVLISILILSMVIATSITTMKQLRFIHKQQISHEGLYVAVLNIKDFIDNDICKDRYTIQGYMNSFKFTANCQKQKEQRNYTKNPDGNFGNFLAILYKITLDLGKKNFQKTYIYYKTIIKKIK